MRTLLSLTLTAGPALALLLSFSSCGTLLKDTDLDSLDKVVEMSMGPCYGNCPVYTLTVYHNGIVAYHGERFTDRRGVYIRDIGRTQLRELQAELVKANLWQFPSAFKSQIPDLPAVTIEYFENGDSKRIRGKDGRPPQVLRIQELLEQIANGSGWKLKTPADGAGAEDFIPDELIVQLDQEVQSEQWARQYAKQELKIIKRLAPNNTYWLIRYNTDIMPPQEMLRWIRQDPDVIKAEFNRTVTGRERQR